MGGLDTFEAAVPPQLIPVTYFDMGIALLEMVLQRIQEQVLVAAKDIGLAAVTPMDVAEKDHALRVIRKGYWGISYTLSSRRTVRALPSNVELVGNRPESNRKVMLGNSVMGLWRSSVG